MKAIAFGMTVPPLMAREKEVTRRDWKATRVASFSAGERVWALDKQYRQGGKRIGVIELTHDPYLEPTMAIPDEDWRLEGFEYMERLGLELKPGLTPRMMWEQWKGGTYQVGSLWVVRFRVIELYPEVLGG